nr:catalase [Lysobacter pythonis]
MTRDNGAPVGDNQNSQTAGPDGPVLLQDVHLIEKLQRFDRERIPERVVHARGTGAFGRFVSSGDHSALTQAAPFLAAGKVTPVFVRFSTVIHPSGSPETLRDPHGFATKFYSDQGNWDLVGNNLPIFFIRDAIKFPDMVHSLKPSPINNVQDPNRFFDFFSHQPESTHMLTQVYSDLGTPASYRMMDGNGVHAYKFINAAGEVRYVKFNWRSNQGVKTLDLDQVAEVQSRDFNHLTNDLYGAIGRGEFPSWDLYVQVLKPEQLNGFAFNPLDATKIWPDVPAVKLGTMTLDKVPGNFFQSTEQSAFAPANLIPGIEPSEDRLLQGRIFSYADTQLYRLGANHKQLPINAPRNITIANHNQDGFMRLREDMDNVNYQPSRTGDGHVEDRRHLYSQLALSGATQQQRIAKTDNFSQAGAFWRGLSRKAQGNLIRNLAADLGQVRDAMIKNTMVAHFYKADADYGRKLASAVKADLREVERIAAKLEG